MLDNVTRNKLSVTNKPPLQLTLGLDYFGGVFQPFQFCGEKIVLHGSLQEFALFLPSGRGGGYRSHSLGRLHQSRGSELKSVGEFGAGSHEGSGDRSGQTSPKLL